MRRRTFRHLAASVALLATAATAGCGSETALIAGLVSGVLSPGQSAGGGATPDQPYASGAGFREAAVAAVDQVGAGISSSCRARLPAADPAAPATGGPRCAVRPLCLPGATQPVHMMACRQDPPL